MRNAVSFMFEELRRERCEFSCVVTCNGAELHLFLAPPELAKFATQLEARCLNDLADKFASAHAAALDEAYELTGEYEMSPLPPDRHVDKVIATVRDLRMAEAFFQY